MSTFQEWMQKAVAPGQERLIPGAVALAANKDGIIYSSAFGTQSLNPESPLSTKPISVDTVMWIASCSKLMTAIAVLQLVEKGVLDLDADVTTWLPEWKDVDVLKGFTDDGEPIYEKAKEKITIRKMMSHQSGIGYGLLDERLIKLVELKKKKGEEVLQEGDIKSHILPLLSEPGTTWAYGANFEWLGQVIERATGVASLGDYLRQNIWGPLGIKAATFEVHTRPEILEARSDMSLRIPNGPLVPSPTRFFPEHPGYHSGGGGMHSSPAEYIKLLIAVLQNDGKLLKPETLDLLFEPQLTPAVTETLETVLFENGGQSSLSQNLPRSARPIQALGGMVSRNDVVGDVFGGEGKRRNKGTLTWGGLPNLVWTVDRKAGIVLFYATQVIPPGDKISLDAFRRFEEAVYSGEIGGSKL